ncbi:MAG TPA: diguanylate cyclase [Solirubrobacteraceae bacterium]|nr:diguanylate cyclase [Solirubrobacteraceae bacterium]
MSSQHHRRRPRFSILAKLILIVLVMVPVAMIPVWAGLAGVEDMRGHANQIDYHEDAVADAGAVSAALSDAQAVALRVIIAGTSTKRAEGLMAQFRAVSAPRVNATIATLESRSLTSGAVGREVLAKLESSWQHVLQRLPELNGPPAARANALDALFAPALKQVASIRTAAASATDRAHALAMQSASASRQLVVDSTAIMVLIGCCMITLAALAIVPRLRRYARFACAVARREASSELMVTGSDEIASLGAALNEMVRRHAARELHDSRQAEFGHAMQLAETETEAQELLERHIGRAVPGSVVVTLKHNNSADRLEPSHLPAESPDLRAALGDARPGSCMAMRIAHPHSTEPGSDELISCPICGRAGAGATCEPLIVSGEVIGSVLTLHTSELSEEQHHAISESVSLAAPAMGNLRNLALAERRAATDMLTGLPNRRSLQDTLNMMVAQAVRSGTSLAALALDLDHFKLVNDTHGHEVGDRLLAAVGAELRGTLRESDFASRAGGEEFVVLLPDTDLNGAYLVGEKIRQSIERIEIPSIPRRITISIGIAALPDQARDATELLRLADRALYAAKSGGRNRCEIFAGDQPARQVPMPSATNGA